MHFIPFLLRSFAAEPRPQKQRGRQLSQPEWSGDSVLTSSLLSGSPRIFSASRWWGPKNNSTNAEAWLPCPTWKQFRSSEWLGLCKIKIGRGTESGRTLPLRSESQSLRSNRSEGDCCDHQGGCRGRVPRCPDCYAGARGRVSLRETSINPVSSLGMKSKDLPPCWF